MIDVQVTPTRRAYKVAINGKTLKRWHRTESTRYLYRSLGQDVVAKVDWDFPQAHNEAVLWYEEIEPQDRPYFAPILAFGFLGKLDYLGRQLGWIMQPYLDLRENLNDEKVHPDNKVWESKVDQLVAKYKIGDWHHNQWAVDVRSNLPVIVDYASWEPNCHCSFQPRPSRLVAP